MTAITEAELSHDHGSRTIDQAHRVVIEERIAELWRWRSWYRARAHTLTWPVRYDNAIELRALVRVARTARRMARGAAAGQPRGVSYHDWQAR